MAGSALEILKMSHFCEPFIFWNGYIHKENERYEKGGGGGGGQVPSPAQPLSEGNYSLILSLMLFFQGGENQVKKVVLHQPYHPSLK